MGSCFNLLFFISMIPVFHCQECAHDVTPPVNSLSSPNHPNNYRNNLECTWKISVWDSFRIKLWFTAFEFQPGWFNSCADYLEMWDGGSTTSVKLFKSCAESLEDFRDGNNGTATIISSGNMLFIKMTTNRNQRRKGFLATFISIPERPVTVSTSPDMQSTSSKGTTVPKTSTPQREIFTTTLVGLFSASSTANSSSTKPLSTISANSLRPHSTIFSDNPWLQTTPLLDSSLPSQSFLAVVTAVPFVLLLSCIGVIGIFLYKKRSKGKSSTSSTGHSPSAPLERTDTVVCYLNETCSASPQSLYPPPYQSISVTEDSRSLPINTVLDERYIANAAYESYEEEGKGNDDDVASQGEVFNISYESYDQERKTGNGDDEANTEQVSNVVYESYDVRRNVDNVDVVTEETKVPNTGYESYDDKNKVPRDGDAEDFAETYQTIDDSQSANDDYAKVRNESKIRLEDNIIYEPYNKDE